MRPPVQKLVASLHFPAKAGKWPSNPSSLSDDRRPSVGAAFYASRDLPCLRQYGTTYCRKHRPLRDGYKPSPTASRPFGGSKIPSLPFPAQTGRKAIGSLILCRYRFRTFAFPRTVSIFGPFHRPLPPTRRNGHRPGHLLTGQRPNLLPKCQWL